MLMALILFVCLGLAAGLLLAFLSRALAVPEAEEVQRVREALPGINCGVCGYSGCDQYARACVEERIVPDRCVPGGEETSRRISGITGVAAGGVAQRVAFVGCAGGPQDRELKFAYRGMHTCAALNQFYGGDRSCPYGCLGLGDCVKACAYGALTLAEGVARVDPGRCTGCLMCVKSCPKGLIQPLPRRGTARVVCSSRQGARETRQDCKRGCIGCGKCARTCEQEAIVLREHLAVIDPEKCTGCGRCAQACPVGCIEMAGEA